MSDVLAPYLGTEVTPSAPQRRAVLRAADAADATLLSQTVFRARVVGSSWQSTHALSASLRGAHLLVTVLPRRYFTGYWLF